MNPAEFNTMVDDAIPLNDLIKPDIRLRRLLQDIDRSKVRLWLLSNANIKHIWKVVRLLGVDDLFDGATHCDYSTLPLLCKPQAKMFQKAMEDAGVSNKADCYFVGKYIN